MGFFPSPKKRDNLAAMAHILPTVAHSHLTCLEVGSGADFAAPMLREVMGLMDVKELKDPDDRTFHGWVSHAEVL